MQAKKNGIVKILIMLLLTGLLIGGEIYLLKGDAFIFLTWYLSAFVIGLFTMPLTGRLFGTFEDKGWMFSKVLGIAISGFLTWLLVSLKVMLFTTGTCLFVTAIFFVVCICLYFFEKDGVHEIFPVSRLTLVWAEELGFFLFFLIWTYLAGFHPQAYGTEKFMDYGFMEAMMRSTTLPPTDMWYSGGTINYYYGGQYYAVFLTKLTLTRVEETYNLMRAFVAAFAFSLPCSLVWQMFTDRVKDRFQKAAHQAEGHKMQEQKALEQSWGVIEVKEGSSRNAFRLHRAPVLAGVTAGLAVSIAGNVHYVVYRCIIPIVQKLTGADTIDTYWFPNATRYIGFNPEVANDKTIHEFPCYSFVLGDLHAHVVNIMFVLLLVGLLYAYMNDLLRRHYGHSGRLPFALRELLRPHILLGSLLLGIFHWTNFWDFVIYFVVMGGVILFTNIVHYRKQGFHVIMATILQALEMAVVSTAVILPFTLSFSPMISGVKLAQNHSMPHQLLILWGLPVVLSLCLVIAVIFENTVVKKIHGTIFRRMRHTSIPDLFAIITALCAIGLVAIPEVVYVRDIYEATNARANTMFKLTYQAYILFGITIGYAIFRLIIISRQRFFKIVSVVGLILWFWTLGYFFNCIGAWYSNYRDPSAYQGLYALSYLDTDFREDKAAIEWLKKNVTGSPVVLECDGSSYTADNRVSASTGLPTVLGWYVHEWLWRSNTPDLDAKAADIRTIYTSADDAAVKALLEKYHVSYIFVGSREKEKYGEELLADHLKSLGSVCFEDTEHGTFIVKID